MHHVLLLTENYPPDRGGMAESCDRIVRSLRARGVVVDVAHFDRRTTAAAFRSTTNGSHLRWPVDGNAAHAINCLWNRLRQNKDIEGITHVIAFGGALPIAAAPMIAALMRRPLITLLRGSEFDAGLFDARRRPLLDDALRRSAAICAVTGEQEEKVLALHEGSNVYRIGNGIDFDHWQPSNGDRERARALRETLVAARVADTALDSGAVRHGEPPAALRVVGLFGDFKAKKGVPFFLEVARRGFHDRFHFLLAGETHDELRAYLEAHQDLIVTRLPSRDRYDLMPLYLACDFVAIPSHYDGFPNVLIESAALGIACLASAVGGARDILRDGVNAIVFAPGDEHDCRRAIAQAARLDDMAIQALGTAAKATVRQHCRSDHEANEYLRVLDETRSVLRALKVQ